MTIIPDIDPTRTRTQSTLDRAPARHPAALEVLRVAGDNRASAADLAEVLATDPAMSAQVLKVANSAYYGLTGRVRSLPFAVTVVGFVSVHSIAAAYVAGALGVDADAPDGFWERAASSASSCSAVAVRTGVPRAEGLCLGILHELGDLLLLKADPLAHADIHAATQPWNCRGRARLEQQLLGAHHGELLAHDLAAWNFPDDLVDAVRIHPEAGRLDAALATTLVAGHALSALTSHGTDEDALPTALIEQIADPLEAAGIRPEHAWALSRIARADATLLAATLPQAA